MPSSSQQGAPPTDKQQVPGSNERKPRKPLPAGLVLNSKWEIIEHIASGAKGDVYRAHQKKLDRDVALKIISPDFIDNLKGHEEELEAETERFRREVQAIASIRHPNVVQVFDYDTEEIDDAILEYLVLEYISGSTLRLTMPEQGIGFNRDAVVNWIHSYFLPVLQGLNAVHDGGMVHRDIKPENILMDGEIPKLADFGLASMSQNHGLTRTFDILGTIFYMPKEQFEDGSTVDARADIYALGKILFEAVTGKITNSNKVVFKKVRLPSPDPAADTDGFFRSLDCIIQSATSEEPEDRTPSVALLYESLTNLIAPYIKEDKGKAAFGILHAGKAFYGIIITLLLCIFSITFYHFFLGPDPDNRQSIAAEAGPPLSPFAPASIHQLPEKLTEADGASLTLVQGGPIQWIPEPDKPLQTDAVSSFYIEEEMVTNKRYVTYLNAVHSTLTVNDSVVSCQGAVLFLLGEVHEGYEPIVYQNNTFSVKNSEDNGKPVVRVSPEGAQAYAHYYSRELPSPTQWLLSQQKIQSEKNTLASGEWGYLNNEKGDRFFALTSGIDSKSAYCPLARQKWEALPDIGFRTIRPVIEGGEK